jgi:hypothetical protein
MSLYRPSSRMAVACAAALTVSGLAVVGAVSTQPAAAVVTGFQDIRINEVTSDASKTIELFNAGTTSVDINGWQVSERGAAATPPSSIFTTKNPIVSTSTVIPVAGLYKFTSPVTLASADGVAIYTSAADGSLPVDRVDWAAGNAAPSFARCGGDGIGTWVKSTSATFGTAGAANAAGCPASIPDANKVKINEVSQDVLAAGEDLVELYNGGAADVSVAGWTAVDSSYASHALQPLGTGAGQTNTTPAGASVPHGGYAYFHSSNGLGGQDSVFVFDANGNSVDSVTWAAGGATPSDSRCLDHTGWFAQNASPTFGTSNTCSAPVGPPDASGCTGDAAAGTNPPTGTPRAWPGSQMANVIDTQCAFVTANDAKGEDMSGLAFDPADPTILWAVQNKNWLWKLKKVSGHWIPDTGWAQFGKQIFFTGGTGLPDTEGLTVGGNGHIYVTTERDNSNNNVPKDEILEFDPLSTATSLSPIHEYAVSPQYFPGLLTTGDANLGFEGVGFVPDSWLVQNGWVNPLTNARYHPENYPLHGTGLFFAGLEKDGTLHVYGLNADGTFITFGTIATGQKSVEDVFFDSGTQRVVATCDNTCSETHTFMRVLNGAIRVDVVYRNPTSMPINNLEGFAIAPMSTCVHGVREAVWSDDGNYGINGAGPTFEHALWSGTFPCGALTSR